jgi:hypothetical protein
MCICVVGATTLTYLTYQGVAMMTIICYILSQAKEITNIFQLATIVWSLFSDWLIVTCLLMFAPYDRVLNFICLNLGNCTEGEDCRCCTCNWLPCCRWNWGERYNAYCVTRPTGAKILTALFTMLNLAGISWVIEF